MSFLRRILVKSNPNSIQFSLQQRSLLSTFRSVKNHQNQITCLNTCKLGIEPEREREREREREG